MKKILVVLLLSLWCALLVPGYDVLVLGDLHFDAAELRDPAKKLKAYQQQELERNMANWTENIPAMLEAAGKQVNANTAFAVQLGDITQGDCGAKALQEKSFQNVLARLKQYINVKLLPVKGNHDIRGEGAEAAYDQVMLPYLTAALGLEKPLQERGNYAFMLEKDLFIFFDCIKPDLAFVKATLAQYPQSRHLFFLTHYPLIPAARSSGADWIIFGRPDQAELRRELLKLLAHRNAIVLTAHIHQTNLAQFRHEAGTITQLASFSLVSRPKDSFRSEPVPVAELFQTASARQAREKNKNFAAVIGDYDGKYDSFERFYPGAGFNVLKIDDSGVSVDMYFGAAAKPVKTLKLR